MIDIDDSRTWAEHQRRDTPLGKYSSRQENRRKILDSIKCIEIEYLQPWQARINKVLDVYLTHGKWHHIPTNTRGWYKNVEPFIEHFLKTGQPKNM